MSAQDTTCLKRAFVGFVVVASAALVLVTVTPSGAGKQPVREKPLLAGSTVPVPVRAILRRACQDCHSQNTIWPWYANIPPISAQIHSDVVNGRAFMDLSKWNDYTEGERRGFAAAIGVSIQNHIMPPPKYVWMHREARMSSDEIELVKAWALARHEFSAKTVGSQTSVRVRGRL